MARATSNGCGERPGDRGRVLDDEEASESSVDLFTRPHIGMGVVPIRASGTRDLEFVHVLTLARNGEAGVPIGRRGYAQPMPMKDRLLRNVVGEDDADLLANP